MKAYQRCRSHPTQKLTETGLPLGKIDAKADAEGRQISFQHEGLSSRAWHTDVAFEPRPALFTILQMVRDFSNRLGLSSDTHLLSQLAAHHPQVWRRVSTLQTACLLEEGVRS